MHAPAIVYFCSVSVLVLVFALSLRLYRRKRAFRPGDGILVLDGWGTLPRGLTSLLILVCAAIPLILYVSGLIFGGILAYIEGWEFSYGFTYTVANMIDLPGIAASHPTTRTAGKAVDLVISLWVLLVTNVVLGVATSLNIVAYVIRKLPDSYFSLLRCLLLYTPVALLVLSVVSGVLLAWLESWRSTDGMVFMVGSLCGLAKPLTDVAPKTRQGYFFLSLCFAVELALGGAVVGVVGSHPATGRLLQRLEGKTVFSFEETKMKEDAQKAESAQNCEAYEQLRADQLEVELQRERQALQQRLEDVQRIPRLEKAHANMREKELQLENEQLHEEKLRLSVMARPSVQMSCADASLGCGRTSKVS